MTEPHTLLGALAPAAPLAARLRPTTLDEIVGQADEMARKAKSDGGDRSAVADVSASRRWRMRLDADVSPVVLAGTEGEFAEQVRALGIPCHFVPLKLYATQAPDSRRKFASQHTIVQSSSRP